MDKHVKQYLVRLGSTLVIYTALLFGSVTVVKSYELPVVADVALALLPVLPAIVMLFVIVAFVRTRDEVQQRVITESVLWGVGIVGIASFTYGFLQNVIDVPDISLLFVLPALIGTSGLAQIFVRMRYS